ncbi:DUF3299 domain-containing protein [Blastopirellula marina]|uniref:DUF3299 domain-containing protein n=1 Tax=Blastopirellula marina TaxID=124 RepID=A0A2S8FP03_9BACT|nr:DUF3299 domain-containing protein [Blastopirellula marina]PQO33919.1 hypothetical protein C5Y98_17000 [Blastopirellula marina]PTL43705.1 DUF3299 domain-containing protein [Blastopirellula marina]
MSTTTESNSYFSGDVDPAMYEQYRSISSLAVTALLIGFVSLVALLAFPLILISLIGIAMGIWAAISVRKNRATQTGFPLAVTGIILSTLTLFAGTGRYIYEEYFDLPPGYEVVAFGLLQKQPGQTLPVPDSALELNGKQVLLRGYVYPHSQKKNLTRFVMVPDFDTCCFGGQPALTDMVEVRLAEPLKVDFSFNRRKIGGTLRVHTDLKKVEDLTGVFYELEADYVD